MSFAHRDPPKKKYFWQRKRKSEIAKTAQEESEQIARENARAEPGSPRDIENKERIAKERQENKDDKPERKVRPTTEKERAKDKKFIEKTKEILAKAEKTTKKVGKKAQKLSANVGKHYPNSGFDFNSEFGTSSSGFVAGGLGGRSYHSTPRVKAKFKKVRERVYKSGRFVGYETRRVKVKPVTRQSSVGLGFGPGQSDLGFFNKRQTIGGSKHSTFDFGHDRDETLFSGGSKFKNHPSYTLLPSIDNFSFGSTNGKKGSRRQPKSLISI